MKCLSEFSNLPAVEATDAVEESTTAVADSTESTERRQHNTTSEVTNTSRSCKNSCNNEGVEVKKNLLKQRNC